MAGEMKKSIKSNIINPSIKYKNEQEKVGEVLEINEDAGTCTVSLVTRDGIKNVIYNVAVLHNEEGIIPWQPEAGDLVRLKEQYKRFVITGKVDLSDILEAHTTLYDDVFPDNTSGGCGFIGYN